jgi:hypothetical protein
MDIIPEHPPILEVTGRLQRIIDRIQETMVEDDVTTMCTDFATLTQRDSVADFESTMTTLEKAVDILCGRLSETLLRASISNPFDEHVTVNIPLSEPLTTRRSEKLADLILADNDEPLSLTGAQKS